jgi:O-antigen ligase
VSGQQAKPPTFAGWMGSMWLYTILRFGLFFALWGLLVLAGLHGFIAAVIAIVLSLPLSYVLLARPRARFAANIEQRVNAHRESRAELDQKLSGEDPSAIQ